MYYESVVMEVKDSKVIVLTTTGDVFYIKKKGNMYVGQKIFVLEEDRIFESTIPYKRIGATMVAGLMLILVIVGTLGQLKKNNNTTVYIQGDYGIELTIDNNDKIVDIDNLDSKDVEYDKKWIGKQFNDVVNDIIDNVAGNGNKVSYKVTGKHKNRNELFLQESIKDLKEQGDISVNENEETNELQNDNAEKKIDINNDDDPEWNQDSDAPFKSGTNQAPTSIGPSSTQGPKISAGPMETQNGTDQKPADNQTQMATGAPGSGMNDDTSTQEKKTDLLATGEPKTTNSPYSGRRKTTNRTSVLERTP